MPIFKRNIRGQKTFDPSSIAATTYNEHSGAIKHAEVGRHLIAIPNSATTVTTNATTALSLPFPGKNIAVYNNANAVGSITLGEDGTITSLAPGVTDVNKHVGIPCAPNSWTYIACYDKQWVIASAATLLVFLIDDDTSVKQESTR
jgi:hypothetical protein